MPPKAKAQVDNTPAEILDPENVTPHDDSEIEEDADRGDSVEGADEGADEDEAGAKKAPEKKAPAKKEEKKEGDEEAVEDDEEEEADEEGEEGTEDADEEGQDPDEGEVLKDKQKPNPTVPRARLTEAQQKRREAERRAAELEEQLEQLREQAGQGKAFKDFTAKVDKLYEDVEVARAEGDYKKAAQLQRQLDELRENASTARAKYLATQQAIQAQDTAAYNAVVEQVEMLVPELNPRNEAYDEDIRDEVAAVVAGFESNGTKPADALKKALRLVLGRDVFTQPGIAAKAKEPPAKKKTDIAKNIAAAKKTPPDVQKGAPAEKALAQDANQLSDEEFDKLPEAVKRRMRGDFME